MSVALSVITSKMKLHELYAHIDAYDKRQDLIIRDTGGFQTSACAAFHGLDRPNYGVYQGGRCDDRCDRVMTSSMSGVMTTARRTLAKGAEVVVVHPKEKVMVVVVVVDTPRHGFMSLARFAKMKVTPLKNVDESLAMMMMNNLMTKRSTPDTMSTQNGTPTLMLLIK
jgi:hypothetical protein